MIETENDYRVGTCEQGYRVGWLKANTKAIQAIGTNVITHNPRVSVSHDNARRRWRLHINNVRL